MYAEQGLFFDPVRLVDGITLSDDPLLVGRTRTYPLSLARRHTDGVIDPAPTAPGGA